MTGYTYAQNAVGTGCTAPECPNCVTSGRQSVEEINVAAAPIFRGDTGNTMAYRSCTLCGAEEGQYHFNTCPKLGNTPYGDDTKPSNPKDAESILDNRVALSLFPDTAVVAGAMAFTEGDAKYGGHNYRIAGVRASVYMDAEERHMKAWRNGEDIDPDSGLPHLWKALACIAVLIDATECKKLTDDRPPRAPVADMLVRLKKQVAEIRKKHANRVGVRRFTIEDSDFDVPDHWR